MMRIRLSIATLMVGIGLVFGCQSSSKTSGDDSDSWPEDWPSDEGSEWRSDTSPTTDSELSSESFSGDTGEETQEDTASQSSSSESGSDDGTMSDSGSQDSGTEDTAASDSGSQDSTSQDSGSDSDTESEALPCFANWTQRSPIGWEMGSISDVWTADNGEVFAVGGLGGILRYDGQAFANLSSPTRGMLTSVHGTGPDDVWVGGSGGVMLHYDGSSVSTLDAKLPTFVEAIYAMPGPTLWAWGSFARFLRYQGGQWDEVSKDSPTLFGTLAGGFVHSPKLGLFAFGREGSMGEFFLDSRYTPLLFSLSDSEATKVDVPLSGDLADAVVLENGDVLFLVVNWPWTILFAGESARLVRFDGVNWTIELAVDEEPVPVDLAQEPDGDVLMLDEAGGIWRRLDGEWTFEDVAPAETARFLVAPQPGERIVVDRASGLVQQTQEGWTRIGGSCSGGWLHNIEFADGATYAADMIGGVVALDEQGCEAVAVDDGFMKTSVLAADVEGNLYRGVDFAPARVERFDGSDWHDLGLPTGGHRAIAFDLDEAGQVLAVLPDTRTLARLDDGNWTDIAPLPAAGVDLTLALDGAASASGPIYFLSYSFVVAVYDQNAWSAVEIPNGHSAVILVKDLAHEVYAITVEGSVYQLSPDSAEEIAQVPLGEYSVDAYRDIWIAGPEDVYALASRNDAFGVHELLHFDGEQWSSSPAPENSGGRLFGNRESELVVLGSDLGYFIQDGQWQPFEMPDDDGWKSGAVFVSPQELYIAYDNETLYRFDGVEWTTLFDFGEWLYSDWRLTGGDGDKGLWTNEKGDVYVLRDGSWSLEAQGPLCVGPVSALWSSGPQDVYAGCSQYGLFHFDGQGWAPVDSGLTQNFRDVWGTGPSDVWVSVGYADTGPVLAHFDGAQWRLVEGPLGEVSALWGTAPDNVYALFRNLYHFNGETWHEELDLPGNAQAIAGRSADDVYVLSLEDVPVLHHFDGQSWSRAELPDHQLPSDVSFDEAGRGLMVGAGGLILEQTCDPRTEGALSPAMLPARGSEFLPL